MTAETIPYCMTDVYVGVNPLALSRLIKTTTLTGEQIKRVKVNGIEHLPALVAQVKGLVPLTFTRAEGCGRFSTTGLYALQSLPSAWRPALTATEEGKTLLYADWKCSHWQIIAYQSGDSKMIEDVESGDLYDRLRPAGMDGPTRKQIKIAGNAHLNGSGLAATKGALGSTAAAKKFKTHIATLFTTRWPSALAWTEEARNNVWKRGGSPKGANFALGIGLMQTEARHLVSVLNDPTFKKHFDLLLPMHDGILVQCDDEDVDAAKAVLTKLMVETFTQGAVSEDPDGHHVDIEVYGTSWGQETLEDGSEADVEVLTGEGVENAAYAALAATDEDDRLLLAAVLIPDALRDAKEDHAPQSKIARAIKKALRDAHSATGWADRKGQEESTLPRPARRRMADGSQGPIENTSSNLQMVLIQDPRFDLWTNEWTHKIHDGDHAIDYGNFTHQLKVYLQGTYGWNCQCSHRDIEGAVSYVASQTQRHPLRERIDALPWDGKDRMNWLGEALYRGLTSDLAKECGVEITDVSLTVTHGRNLVIGMMARLYDPGCKMDEVLVLAGSQGVGKQRIWHALLGDSDLYEGTSFAGMDSKDKAAVLASAWIYEDQEMSSGSAAKEESKKAFLSNAVDTVRLPYARSPEKLKRHCVLVGSTNLGERLLKDLTGSRRYNVVKVPRIPSLPDWSPAQPVIDVAWVKANADQILAQAREIYKNSPDPKWWIDKGEDEFGQREVQNREKFTAEDEWAAPARRVFAANAGGELNGFTALQFARKNHPDTDLRALSGKLGHKIREALKSAGFVPKRSRSRRFLYRPLPLGTKPHTSDIINGLSAFHRATRENFHHGGFGAGQSPDDFRDAFRDGSNTSRPDSDDFTPHE